MATIRSSDTVRILSSATMIWRMRFCTAAAAKASPPESECKAAPKK